MIRCTQTMLRGVRRQQDLRRKDEEQPSERAGYWFRDVSVPAPADDPSDGGDIQPGAFDQPNPTQSGDAAPAVAPRQAGDVPPRPALQASGTRENPLHSLPPGIGSGGEEAATSRLNPMQSGDTTPTTAPRDPGAVPPRSAPQAAGSPENPMQSLTPGAGPRDGELATSRLNPMQSGKAICLPDHSSPRFASRRLDPNQSVEEAWAQATAEAAAEEAEAAGVDPVRRCAPAASAWGTPHAP